MMASTSSSGRTGLRPSCSSSNEYSGPDDRRSLQLDYCSSMMVGRTTSAESHGHEVAERSLSCTAAVGNSLWSRLSLRRNTSEDSHDTVTSMKSGSSKLSFRIPVSQPVSYTEHVALEEKGKQPAGALYNSGIQLNLAAKLRDLEQGILTKVPLTAMTTSASSADVGEAKRDVVHGYLSPISILFSVLYLGAAGAYLGIRIRSHWEVRCPLAFFGVVLFVEVLTMIYGVMRAALCIKKVAYNDEGGFWSDRVACQPGPKFNKTLFHVHVVVPCVHQDQTSNVSATVKGVLEASLPHQVTCTVYVCDLTGACGHLLELTSRDLVHVECCGFDNVGTPGAIAEVVDRFVRTRLVAGEVGPSDIVVVFTPGTSPSRKYFLKVLEIFQDPSVAACSVAGGGLQVEHSRGVSQDDFFLWHQVLPTCAAWGAPLVTGSGVALRAPALVDLGPLAGGPCPVWHLALSFRLRRQGLKWAYLQEHLVRHPGYVKDLTTQLANSGALARQELRVFWSTWGLLKIDGLTLWSRLCYWVYFGRHLEGLLSAPLALFIPVIAIATGQLPFVITKTFATIATAYLLLGTIILSDPTTKVGHWQLAWYHRTKALTWVGRRVGWTLSSLVKALTGSTRCWSDTDQSFDPGCGSSSSSDCQSDAGTSLGDQSTDVHVVVAEVEEKSGDHQGKSQQVVLAVPLPAAVGEEPGVEGDNDTVFTPGRGLATMRGALSASRKFLDTRLSESRRFARRALALQPYDRYDSFGGSSQGSTMKTTSGALRKWDVLVLNLVWLVLAVATAAAALARMAVVGPQGFLVVVMCWGAYHIAAPSLVVLELLAGPGPRIAPARWWGFWITRCFALVALVGLFLITPPVNYGAVVQKSLTFFDVQRSGPLSKAPRPVPWRGDSFLQDGSVYNLNLSGGWFDDGGFVKHSYSTAFAVTLLSWSYRDFPAGYQSRDGDLQVQLLDTIRWGSEYLLRCHGVPGRFVVQVGDRVRDQEYWGRPEDFRGHRQVYMVEKNTAASDILGSSAAALAAAATVFHKVDANFSQHCHQHAVELYEMARANLGTYNGTVGASKYPSKSFMDDLAWGACWLYIQTGNREYLQQCQEFHQRSLQEEYQGQLGTVFTYESVLPAVEALLYDITRDLTHRSALQQLVEQWIRGTGGVQYTPQGLARPNVSDASLFHTAAMGYLALVDARHSWSGSAWVQCWVRGQIGGVLGGGGYSYMVGFGPSYPRRVHHRAASCKGPDCTYQSGYLNPGVNPHDVTGALVNGPNGQGVYTDDRQLSNGGNKVSLLNNAALTATLAGLKGHGIDKEYCSAAMSLF